ncbi:MAG: phosphoglycolate phosphatase [Glomeribacter sp. 1016415]|uniref:phosphoglycolate phosphatase n=1 Tax=Mycoavidus cysteinexigens TaxID=1553431 RepID=A0A2Z6EWV8_9BURK|nr:HAD-IA family hydrolase [Mycoavidus cysteinexigens]MCX8566610.1 phosphoglycolate phosphatase [Glomeribacter sp. 1016415]BBE09929.1 phosphoglycolate phosphatase [Mycoavidus cysteinexigens]GAM53726.1 similar to phosphoglycolate phosphatase, clustered with ubiquinone biosynthesis SAM-dependent O-methyltransferase [bacterium endosymbiont of Mortierella elongata FMR23-6]GLR00369.1 phosphatase [Mycoavidus cysteinexigens]
MSSHTNISFISPSAERAILFDLDGTLADTAPNLAAAANKMRQARGMAMLPLEQLRPFASAGARGLLKGAFGVDATHADLPTMVEEFLINYAADLDSATVLFPGIAALLAELSAHQVRWGIVTNKIDRLTQPLVERLGLNHASCVVSGDTTAHAKPHPAPLLYAAQQLQLIPTQIVYIGDDLRDIQAGQAAGMKTIAAAYGYGGQLSPEKWQANYIVDSPAELRNLLFRNKTSV